MQRTCQPHIQRVREAVPARSASSTADGSTTSQTKTALLSSGCAGTAPDDDLSDQAGEACAQMRRCVLVYKST